ncbi:MAG TPA: TonB-dependent receptor [Vicinamibacteria bacterium]|nr:TonB-dependent receptor [Vicinamibacteria bacterium]
MGLRRLATTSAALLLSLPAGPLLAATGVPEESAPQTRALDQAPAPAPEASQEGPVQPVRHYEAVTVTASKASQRQDEITQAVRVIDGPKMDRLPLSPNRNLSELLSYEPGSFVSVLSRNDANWGSGGGLGPKYNSYLLDGQPIDAFVDGMSVDPWAIERVEVQHGPAAVMYSNYLAMDFAGNQTPLAGVTNYVLRDRIDAPLTRIELGGGSWGTFGAQGYHQARAGDLNYFTGASFERSDYTNYGAPGSWLGMLDDPQYTKVKLYGKGMLPLGGDARTISLFANYTGHSGDAGRPNRDYDHGYGTLNAAFRDRLGDSLDMHLKAGARLYGRRWGEDRYPDSLALREHDGVDQTVFPADLTFNWRQASEGRLTFGADSQYATYKTYAEADGLRTTGNDASAFAAGLFAQEAIALRGLVLRGGLRYAHSEQSYTLLSGVAPGVPSKSWDRLLWSTGARWNASPSVALFANAGSSFVAPTPKAVGGTLLASDLGVAGRNGQLPNPALAPESGLGTDLGADLRLGHAAHLTVRGFLNRIDDVIVDDVVSQNPSQTRSQNAGKARSLGLEVAFDQALNRSVSWFANTTYTDSRIENPLDLDQDGGRTPFVPDWTANLGGTLSLLHGLRLSPYLHAFGRYYDSSSKSGRQAFGEHWIPAIRVEWAVRAGAAGDVSLAVDLNNLTDNRYAMPWQFQDTGFNAYGSVSLRLK